MKSRLSFWLFAIGVVLVAIVILLARRPSGTPSGAETNAAPPPPTEGAATEQGQLEAGAPVHTNAPTARPSSNAPLTAPPLKTKAESMKEGLAALNDEDVVFYGKAVDQFGSPVASATVAGSVQVNNGTRVGADKISLLTDDNGLFTISGYKGKALGINISKPGYVMATTNTRFVYSLLWSESERHNPEESNPVVVKMWKLQGAEPLKGIDQRYKFHFANAPVNFDLVAGKIVPAGGDIKITLSRSPGVVYDRA
jgi:hypothetical protein